jgi:hypothetical protein
MTSKHGATAFGALSVAGVAVLASQLPGHAGASPTPPVLGFASQPTTAPPSSAKHHAVTAEQLPVHVSLPGWKCADPADEKFLCTHAGTSVQVTVRPASLHGDYLSDPDKAAPGQYVSDVHGDVFATVNGPSAQAVDTIASALTWDD